MANELKQTRSVKLETALARQTFDSEGRPGNIVDCRPGQVVTLDADEAQRFIDAGYASAVQPSK